MSLYVIVGNRLNNNINFCKIAAFSALELQKKLYLQVRGVTNVASNAEIFCNVILIFSKHLSFLIRF